MARIARHAAHALDHPRRALPPPTAVVAVAVLRRARVGLRELLGERAQLSSSVSLVVRHHARPPRRRRRGVLRATTHHHALAGVTFAVFAVMSGIVVALLARRTTAMLDRGGGKLQKVGLTIVGGCAVVVIALVLVRTAKATELHAAAGIVDAIALAICARLTSSRAFTKLRPLAVIGSPVAILVLVIGLTLLRFDPKLSIRCSRRGAPHTLVLDLFGH